MLVISQNTWFHTFTVAYRNDHYMHSCIVQLLGGLQNPAEVKDKLWMVSISEI